MFNLCSDNTNIVFRFPVKSSYLSLPLSPPNSLLAHTAFCSIVTAFPHYAGTYVTAHNIAHRRSYTHFVDTFGNWQKRLLASSWPSVCLSHLLSTQKNRAVKDWFLWNLLFEYFSENIEKFEVKLEYDNNNGTLQAVRCTIHIRKHLCQLFLKWEKSQTILWRKTNTNLM
jgi:hypothetical protein